MGDKDIRMLVKTLLDFAELKRSRNEDGQPFSRVENPFILMDFLIFAIDSHIAWKDLFTLKTLKAFEKYTRFIKEDRGSSYRFPVSFSVRE